MWISMGGLTVGAAALAAVIWAVPVDEPGSVLFVDDDAVAGGDGATWDTAYRFLQDALAIASDPDQGITEIRAAQGVYQPDRDEANPQGTGERAATFLLMNGVTLMGGYAGIGADDPDARDIEAYETILSGDLLGDDGPAGTFENNDENSYHVTTGSDTDKTAVLDGFIITAGNADDFSAQDTTRGGGLYIVNGSPTISSCAIIYNFGARRGGGMYNQDSNPVVINCFFAGNGTSSSSAFSGGGGMYNDASSPAVFGCEFIGNVVSDYGWGGAMLNHNGSNPTVADCMVADNWASDFGGGFLNGSQSDPTITDCVFANNSASLGGAIFTRSNSSPTISSCTFIGNTAEFDGGAMYNWGGGSPSVTDCEFVGNSADFRGGGIFNSSNSSPMLNNSLLSGNSASIGGGMYNESSGAIVTSTTFDGNSAGVGGGFYSEDADPSLIECVFSTNDAVFGAGAYINLGSPTLSQCTFDDNFALLAGAGLYSDTASPSLIECLFIGNFASGDEGGGSGMYNLFGSPTLSNCTFHSNWGRRGAGMYNNNSSPTVTECTFDRNAGLIGAGMYNEHSSPTVADCTFYVCRATNDGGGMYNDESSPSVTNCWFGWNTAEWGSDYGGDGGGGGMYNRDSSPTVRNSTFVGNWVEFAGGGGAIYNDHSDPAITNCVFVGNWLISGGDGGVMFNEDSSPFVSDCTFTQNEGDTGVIYNTTGSSPTLANCILWNNPWGGAIEGPGDPVVEYSVVEGGWPGVGNINANPSFVDPQNNDYRLSPGSPCIDAGDNLAVPRGVEFDLDGNPRFVDDPCADDTGNGERPIVDMGAFEFQGTSCDLDGDGTVGVKDLLILLGSWGPCADCNNCAADLDDDCTVGVKDLLILLGNWG